ncbi:glucan biosynthesis protein [Methylocystis parvus]|uniref:glucan biosynthesis protein n=1 Tax=Methylocystis parvus TaxID=134 RepID=UPI003C738F06
MIEKQDRRSFLKVATSALGAAVAGPLQAQPSRISNVRLGEARPFSFETLKQEAKRLAKEPYRQPNIPSPDITSQIDYEKWGHITYNTDHALFADTKERFPIEFFHLGMFFKRAIRIFAVESGEAREVLYDTSYFNMPENSIARKLPAGAGFAGFRVQESKDGPLDWKRNDWVAFLGASYFRAIGELRQYGMSARGVALDTWQAGANEEFPDFTQIYVGPETNDGVVLHALLEGPSITGAYKFLMTRGKGVVMDIDCALYLRGSFTRFGVAPLTSMYWFSETAKPTAIDWRPEVHDSDGLSMWTGSGERLWRPLNDPERVTASAFFDVNPKGFGLMQRDRNYDHYLDNVFYDRRPSVWVEPKGDWGKGAVHLVEIPTDDEIHDNIVCMWVPEKKAVPGSEFEFSYRLHWLADEPYPTPLARCVATRLGNGGQPGKPRPKGVRKFMVEFLGEPLAKLPYGVKPEPVLWASRGSFSYIYTEAVFDGVPGHWRAQFDLTVDGADPVEMRLSLRNGEKVLTETWLFQYHPF